MDGIAYYCELNAHSIGDTLTRMSYDLAVDDAEVYWILHYGQEQEPPGEQLSNGYLHFALFDLYQWAGLFRNRVHIRGVINGTHEQFTAHFMRYAEIVYNRRHEAMLPLGLNAKIAGRNDAIFNMAAELRSRFAFLALPAAAPYITVQASSSHFKATGVFKRLTIGRMLEHIGPQLAAGASARFVGGHADGDIAARIIAKIQPQFPRAQLLNRCGTSLAGLFAELYGSSFHLCTDSGSGFFTAQLGIPTVKVYPPQCQRAYAGFRNTYREFPNLLHVCESVDVTQDNSDLA